MLITFAGDTLVCTLGDPKGENVTVPGVSQRRVRAEEAKAKSAQKLALRYIIECIVATTEHKQSGYEAGNILQNTALQ